MFCTAFESGCGVDSEAMVLMEEMKEVIHEERIFKWESLFVHCGSFVHLMIPVHGAKNRSHV